MKSYLRRFAHKHSTFWKKEHLPSIFMSGAVFFVALICQRLADTYVSSLRATPVSDVLLDRLPALDIDGLIIASTLLFTAIVTGLFVTRPRYITFGIKTLSLFIITRSFFITLTHLGSSPHELQFSPDSVGYWLYNALYNTHGDFFFSGHTGLPFLMALIFWPETKWRFFCLFTSMVFGVSVLFAHLHYSIDVFAAPFMAYGIFSLAKNLFKSDYTITKDTAK